MGNFSIKWGQWEEEFSLELEFNPQGISIYLSNLATKAAQSLCDRDRTIKKCVSAIHQQQQQQQK